MANPKDDGGCPFGQSIGPTTKCSMCRRDGKDRCPLHCPIEMLEPERDADRERAHGAPP